MSAIRDRDAKLIGQVGKLRFSPIAVERGEGSYFVEPDGRRVLDLSASGCAASLGYGHPAVVEAVSAAVRNMAGASNLMYPNDNAAQLAEQLLGSLPGHAGHKVLFGHSGSDATDSAVRSIQASTGRSRFVSFIGSYHGGSRGSMEVSGHTAQTHTLTRPGLILLPYPDPYRAQFSSEEVLRLIEYQFETTSPPEQVAAVMIEPLMSDGGLIVPPAGFLKALADLCHAHDILVVVDEVKVGIGRTGLMHAFEHERLTPDVVIFGKGIGGGLPLSAVVGPESVLDHAPAFAMQTTAGNPVATGAGLAVLEALEKQDLITNAAELGQLLKEKLHSLAEKHETIGDVRGRGLAIGIDLVSNRETRTPVDPITAAKVIYRCYELGVNLIYVGLSGNVLEITPPLTVTEGELSEGIEILDQAIEDVLLNKVSDDAVAPYMMW